MRKEESTVQIKQIAEAAGFSQSTVSIVLNGRGDEMRISQATQQRITSVAREMNYQPNIYARRLRGISGSQPAQMIGLFWNGMYNDTIGPFINGAYEYLATSDPNCELVIKLFRASELCEMKDSFSPQKFSGIIIGGASREDVDFLEGQQFDVPIVLSGMTSNKYSHIALDGYALGAECARQLAKRDIHTAAYVGTMHIGSHSALRELGFTNGCKMNGITVRPEWLLHMDQLDAVSGYSCAREIIAMNPRPEAVFINYASVATGALFALLESRVRIPEEMKIIVYGVNDILQHTTPSLTMVAQPMHEMGVASIELLMLLIKNSIDMAIVRKVDPKYFWGDSLPRLEEN